MDAQRALLDELMGTARNLTDEEKKGHKELKWDDPDVCGPYMARFCPHDLFVNTKSNLGPCSRIHDPKLKESFEKSPRRDSFMRRFEAELAQQCEKLVMDLDRKIRRGRERLAQDSAVPMPIPGKIAEQLSAREEQLKKLLEQIEELGEAGKVDEAEALMRRVDILNAEKTALANQADNKVAMLEKKMELCETCGSFLVADDALERTQSHVTGKQHIGYGMVRDFLTEYKVKYHYWDAAIMSLQYHCLDPRRHSSALATSTARAGSKSHDSLVPGEESYGHSSALPSPCGRDEILTLFHALGKFLHNKRETSDIDIGLDPFPLRENLRRNSLKMDVPEKILSQAHGKARTVADFLYENVLDFIDNEAVDDAWVVVSYLSEADCLLTGGPIASYNSENMAQLISASVAARGVLFGNAHAATSRWHTIRSPKLWQTEQSFRSNKGQILKERFDCSRTCGSCNFSDLVTEFKPLERWIGPRNDGPSTGSLAHGVGGSLLGLDADGNNSEDDDEIEDC